MTDYEKAQKMLLEGSFQAARGMFLAIAQDEQSDDQAEAQYRLGWIYYTPHCVVKDCNEAVRWYMLSAEQRHVGAIFYLGEICELGGNGMEPNAFNAFTWYSVAVRISCIIMRLEGSEVVYDDKIAVDAKNRVGLNLSDEEKAEAEEKVQEWLDNHPQT